MPPSFLSLARSVALVLAVSLASLASCAEANESACERNSDCDRGYCLEGKCRRDCVSSELDCPKGYTCSAIGRCEFAGEPAGSGGVGGEAGASGASGTTGQSGEAGSGAAGAGNGGAGASNGGEGGSSAGSGGAPGPGGGGAGGSDVGGAGQGGAGAGNGGAGNGGAGGQGGSPFGGGPQGGASELDPCGSDADCKAPLLCRSDFKGGLGRCTRSCSSNTDCYGGRRCELIDGAKVCVMGDVGRTCSAANDCNFACLLNQQYCTTTCKTGLDCPNGYACQPVGSPAQNVCARVAAPCDSNGSACIAPAACDQSFSLLVASCTAACTTAADCPQRAPGLPPWTCDGLCRRPPDVLGPLPGGATPTQYACDGVTPVNLCNDGQHIDFQAFDIPKPPAVNCNSPVTTSGSPNDSCVDSCRYEGGCPWGFTCTAVGNINNSRIGLCLVNGGSPVGASCSSNIECAYGYCVSGKCSRDCTADGLCPTGSTCTTAGGPPAQGLPFKRCQ